MKKDELYNLSTLICILIAVVSLFLTMTLPWSEETHISGDMYMQSTSLWPILMLILFVIFTILSIILAIKTSWEKSKEKIKGNTKKTFQGITIGLIAGFLLVFYGIFLIIYGMGMMGGYGGEVVFGLIFLIVGIVLLINLSILFAYNSKKIKRNLAIGFSIVLSLVIISSIFISSYYLIFTYRYVPSLPYPTVGFDIESQNEEENQITFVLTKLDYHLTLINHELGYKLINMTNNTEAFDYNMVYNDMDLSNSVTTGDTFELTVPSEDEYEFYFIHKPSGNLVYTISIPINYRIN